MVWYIVLYVLYVTFYLSGESNLKKIYLLQASRASEGVVETFNLFLDLLNSYKVSSLQLADLRFFDRCLSDLGQQK